ncbi:hypothetical protein BDM02DRAFT_3113504 [Thelephora ganbajun]|uniref:Uncharacterized protein n=1 Tax=Thelephora ganbajun TaxID=370292 RepID=A0ACB6ZIM3_THEGA|nr:hypothetical protein BDM02DRAFT_3113504 [Thelephora ganbajun]
MALILGAPGPLSLGTNSIAKNAAYTICSSQSPHSPHSFRTQFYVQNMSLHPPVKIGQASAYSALSINPPPHAINDLRGPRVVPILPYKHASKWNTTMYRQHEPFTVTFDTRGMSAGYGVQHGDLSSYSAAIMNTVIVCGGEPVCFPTPSRKIQLRIVWPGYDTVDFSAAIDIHGITVSQLAGRVASLYTEFFKVARQHECTADGWSVTHELLETLRILGIRNAYDNIYQAEVIVG